MSSIPGVSEPAEPQPNVELSPTPTPNSSARRLIAALLSGLVPGAGQLLLAKVRSGAIFLAAFAAALTLFWPLRLLQWYAGFCVSVFVISAVSVAAAWHAVRSAHEKFPRLSKWWLLPILPLAYLASNFEANFALRIAGFQIFKIPSSAMENTLLIGDRIVVDRRYYATHQPEVGDVAVFRREQIWVIKRIISIGGDTILGRDGIVYRNNEPLSEPYTVRIGDPGNVYVNDFGPVTLPPGQIFVIGDNRNVSYDSRQPNYGPVHLGRESGRALYVMWSSQNARIAKSLR